MHERLRQLLQEAMPSLYCAQVKVDDEAFQQGGDEGFIRALRRQLGEMLSRFLIDTKILDGSDGFTMKPDDKLAATECTVRLHVLTPRELEVAGDEGVRSRTAYGSNGGRSILRTSSASVDPRQRAALDEGKGLEIAPKQFQLDGAQFLAARSRALLADEPGVGKTAQVIIAAQQLGATTVRVVCPGVGMEHWRREFTRWWVGDRRPAVEILSYDDARRMARAGLQGKVQTVDVLVLDESHYAKNPTAARTMAVFGKGGLGWFARRIWALSGTPAPNNVSELWPMLRAFNATKLDYETFKHRFCVVDQLGKVRGSRAEAMPELRAILKTFTLRRKKVDVLPELGAIDIQPWYVTPSAQFVTDSAFAEAARKEEAELRRAIQKLPPDELLAFLAGHQEFSTVRRYNALLKVPAVFEQVVFEIEGGLLDKVVIYGHHQEPLDVLGREFNKHPDIRAVVIHGGTPKHLRDGLIQSWKQPDGPRVMCASIIAAGVVLDFTEAHQGIMLELDWVPGNNKQAMERMHRHGQQYPVSIRVANGSPVDEVINDVVARKTKELTAVFD